MIFFKTSEVAKEEARLAEIKALYADGKITTAEYLDAINQLKQSGEGGSAASASTPNVLDLMQLGLFAAIVFGVVYVIKVFKS